ncbi:MAG: hypothetical protein CL596_02780 [Alteromonas sp.]|nr:hypothetical protein [Alteromonas sp.]MAY23488.1 hypothetical protein [Flavobacteriaceae bacterium]|tara:strand:+ start:37781 stop:38155 length:375 start_codon:yes stop_codon:yes gene_type:complete
MKQLLIEDYGIWGVWIMIFPALIVFALGLFSYFVVNLFFKIGNASAAIQKKLLVVFGLVYTLVALLTCWQGTYTETVYLAMPLVLVALIFLMKLEELLLPKKWFYCWGAALLIVLLISFITYFN